MAFSVVQSAYSLGTGSQTIGVSFASLPKIGSDIIVFVGRFGSTLTSLTDNQGHTYTQDENVAGGSDTHAAIYRTRVTASSGTFTVTLSTSPDFHSINIVVVEVEGLTGPTDQVDVQASAGGTTNTPASGNTAATSRADEIVFGYVYGHVSPPNTPDPVTGYTLIQEESNVSSHTFNAAYKVVSATGVQSVSYGTVSGMSAWSALVATYKGPVGISPRIDADHTHFWGG